MRLLRWLPRTLVGRVFALYAVTLVSFVAMAMVLFLQHQFQRGVQAAQEDAQTLFSVLVPVVSESAVIGDYDSIQRQLGRAVKHSSVARITFVDTQATKVESTSDAGTAQTPAWLSAMVAQRLPERIEQLSVGGKAYGELTLRFSAAQIASSLWRDAWVAAILVLVSLLGGLLLIRHALVRWLGHLDRISELGQSLDGGHALAREALAGDAPLEFRKTFEVLDRAASSLQAQREQAQATLEAIEDAVISCDAQGLVSLANRGAQRLLGRSVDQIVGQPLAALLPELELVRLAAPSDRSTGRWQHHELRWSAADGSDHVLDAKGFPIMDADQTVVGEVLALRDVTEQHRLDQHLRDIHASRDNAVSQLRHALERAPLMHLRALTSSDQDDLTVVSKLVSHLVQNLQERTEQLDAIFALSPDGFVSFDVQRTVRYVSPGFSRLSGLPADGLVGLEEEVLLKRLLSRSGSQDKPIVMADLRAAAAAADGGSAVQIEINAPHPRVMALALHQSQTGVVSQVLHLRDITHESVVDRMKTEFLTTASHELRTPMASIFGFVELLITRELPVERQKHMLGVVHRQCKVMIELINELLDLARIEARRDLDFDYQSADVTPLVAEVVEGFLVPDDRLPPRVEAPPHALVARVDPDKLQQVVRNVLSNAYKYSPQGGEVRIRLWQDQDASVSGPRIGVEVRDQGIGMTPEQLERVGERFYRADASGNIPGTGLGMRLVRDVMDLMGGSVSLQSEPGVGTTVTLWARAA